MIDGVKVECNYLDPERWRSRPELRFIGYHDEETGEVLTGRNTARYGGLKFFLTPAKTGAAVMYCEFSGSLHRFANEGGTNAGAFTLDALRATLERLADVYSIEPERSPLHRLEFGVNIEVPGTAADWLTGVIALPDKKFSHLDVREPKLGWVCKRSDYAVKIYDKGKQSGERARNILRVELAVTKMRWIKKTGIVVLADLVDPVKLEALGDVLAAQFEKVVYYRGGVDPAALTLRQRLKLEQFTNPNRWIKATFRERYKMREAMRRFMKIHGGDTGHECALLALQKKWVELLTTPSKKGDVFTGVDAERTGGKKGIISPLEYTVKSSPIPSPDQSTNQSLKPGSKDQPKKVENPRTLKRVCLECGRDISGQQKNARFCSPTVYGPKARKCRDKANRRRRTIRERAAREAERVALAHLRNRYPLATVRVTIEPGPFPDFDWREVPAALPSSVRAVVAVLPEGVAVRLTGSRASKLLNFLTEQAADPERVALATTV